MEKLSEREKGWIAGLIDADGSIIMRRHSEGVSIRPEVKLTNTSLKLLNSVRKLIPEANMYSQGSENDNWAEAYQLVLAQNEEILDLLNSIKDDLVIKKEKADLVIELVEEKISDSRRKRKDDGTFAKVDERPVEEKLFQKFKDL